MTAAPTRTPVRSFGLLGAYWAADVAWKKLVSTGGKWFKDRVWDSAIYYVRRSNAWIAPGRYREGSPLV